VEKAWLSRVPGERQIKAEVTVDHESPSKPFTGAEDGSQEPPNRQDK
jgi:hypothetical protein